MRPKSRGLGHGIAPKTGLGGCVRNSIVSAPMSITPILTLDNKAGWKGNTALVLDHVKAAFGVWSTLLAGQADVHVNVEISSLGTSGSSRILASATIDQYSYTGREGSYLTYESPIATELKSGDVKTGFGNEVTIRIDSTSLSNGTFFIDAAPLTSKAPVGISGSQYDLLSVLVHEVGHTLGMTGWRGSGGTLSGSSQSVFDSLVAKVNGQLVFTGENVKSVSGSYPILDPNSVYHFQASDLLDPFAEPGQRVAPSRLDAALLADLGMGTIYDDTITTQWNRTLDTGSGVDTVALDSFKTGMIIRGSKNEDLIVSGDQELKLINAEKLLLVDAKVSLPEDGFAVRFDENGIGGYAYRLYKAAFDRVPDPKGLGDWIRYLESGGNRNSVAEGFVGSMEFSTKYGTLDNASFVNRLYNNILGRDGEAKGFFDWYNALEHGASRSSVLQGFSESPENLQKTAPLIHDGISYQEWWLV